MKFDYCITKFLPISFGLFLFVSNGAHAGESTSEIDPSSDVSSIHDTVLSESVEELDANKFSGLLDSSTVDFLSASQPGEAQILIRLAFEPAELPDIEVDSTGYFTPSDSKIMLAGRQYRSEAFKELENQRLAQRAYKAAIRRVARERMLQSWATERGLNAANEIQSSLDQDIDTVEIKLTKDDLLALIKQIDLLGKGKLLRIEQAAGGGPGIGGAMLYSNVDPIALGNPYFLGNDIGVFVTEWDGCPATGFTSDYTRLDGIGHWHGDWVVGIVRAVSPNSYIYCSGSARLPTIPELGGNGGNPPIRVINASLMWYTPLREYTSYERDWDDFSYNNDVAIFACAGNSRSGNTTTVESPGKGKNVLAVGNVNDSTATVNNSSLWIDPYTNSEKPEFTAPGTSITAGGQTATGCSAATPHAAGMAADYLDEVTGARERPYMLRALMLASATQVETGNAGGGSDSTGIGGLSFLNDASLYSWFFHFWDGSNGFYSNSSNPYFDGTANVVHYPASAGDEVSVAIAWNTRGSYTYSNAHTAQSVGQQFSLEAYAPNGTFITAGSHSWNSFQIVRFTATTTGNYKFRITRQANHDTSARYELGFAMINKGP
jgi:hypothetical protein